MEAGDMKAMRNALKETQSVIAKCLEILNKIPDSCGYGGFIEDVGDELCYLRDEHVNAALAAPPRNCDVGSASEQSRRFCAFCRPRLEPCDGCSCLEGARHGRCEFVWGQMPYESVKESEAQEGETNGSK